MGADHHGRDIRDPSFRPRDVDDVTDLGACDAPATMAGTEGPITLARCWRPKGHDGAHSGPLEGASWGG